MCWKQPFIDLGAMSPRNRMKLGLLVAACLVLGFGIGHGCSAAPPKPATPVTQKQADAALYWLSEAMPNTRFTAAKPDAAAPMLVRVTAAHSPAPLYFDPVHHYLMIGLVVNLDNSKQVIAAGHLDGGQ